MMKKIALTLLLCFSASAAFADGEYFIPTRVGTSAKMIRQGNIEGFSELSASVFENPAALYRINKFSSSLFTVNLMNEVSYQNISTGVRLPVGMIALGYMAVNVDDIKRAKEIDPGLEYDEDGTFGYKNILAKLAYQLSQNKLLHWGVSLSYFHTSLESYTASGFNVDAGVVVNVDPLEISVTAKNLIPALKVQYSHGQTESLPLQTIVGGRYNWGDLDFLAQMTVWESSRRIGKSGAINYSPNFYPALHLSAGYKEFPVLQDMKSNITVGFGLDLFDISLDYAYERSEHIEYDGKHYFSVGFSY